MSAAHFQVVNVFTSTVFSGNPTCVVFPAKSMMHMSDEWMSKVARETAQPTTSFVDLEMGTVRMFNLHGKEMAILSGHTSLGVAAAVRARTGLSAVDLTSIYGKVSLRSDGLMYEVALPSGKGSAIETMPRATLEEALDIKGSDILQHGLVLGGKFMFAELTPEAFASLTPDIAAIPNSKARGRRCFCMHGRSRDKAEGLPSRVCCRSARSAHRFHRAQLRPCPGDRRGHCHRLDPSLPESILCGEAREGARGADVLPAGEPARRADPQPLGRRVRVRGRKLCALAARHDSADITNRTAVQ